MYMVKRLDLWVNIEENTDEKTQFGKCLFCLTLYCTVLCTVLFRHYYSSGGFPPLPDTAQWETKWKQQISLELLLSSKTFFLSSETSVIKIYLKFQTDWSYKQPLCTKQGLGEKLYFHLTPLYFPLCSVLVLTALQYSWLALQSNYFPDNSISTQTKRYYQFKAFNKINLELVNTFQSGCWK